MENYLENSEILKPELIEIIDKLLTINPNIIFGGSMALNAIGLIKRPIKDIDVFINDSFKQSGLLEYCIEYSSKNESLDCTDINGEPIPRLSAIFNDIHVCIFRVKEFNYSKFNFLGRTINIQNINEAILAKRAYSLMEYKNVEKHKEDIKTIENNLDILFPLIDNILPF